MNSEKIKTDPEQAARIARQQLTSLRAAGLQVLPKPTSTYHFDFDGQPEPAEQTPSATSATSATLAASAAEQPAATTPTVPATSTEVAVSTDQIREPKPAASVTARVDGDKYESAPLPAAERSSQLTIIQNEVAACEACPELVANRSQTVFGVGAASPRLCFLGEGPGADEDRMGEPFVGAAGQLLNKILGACKMKREDVYILNTVKCRPPGNRNPSEQELCNCWGFAQRQLETLQPEFICCLGSVAARTLLQTKMSVGKMRGQFFNYRGSRVVVTYHPAYLLRNPDAKRKVWDDMKMLLQEMGIQL